MNNSSTQAQKGFRTFVLTLSVSLIVFSLVYYFISESQVGMESNALVKQDQPKVEAKPLSANLEEKDESATESVFKKIADSKVELRERAVLAGTDTVDVDPVEQPSPSQVPQTGIFGITAGFIISTFSFLTALYVVGKGPRKLALSSFERKITKD